MPVQASAQAVFEDHALLYFFYSEESSQQIKHANIIIISIFLIMMNTILEQFAGVVKASSG